MKKILLGIAVFFTMAIMCVVGAGAASYETIIVSGDFKYAVQDDGTASIEGYTGTATEVTVPTTIDGLTVTRVGTYAFFNCVNITAVTVPDTVTSIGYYAFSEMDSLTSVKLPETITSIEGKAFACCISLETLTIPSKVTEIGEGAFYGCEALKSLTIPSGVTTIGEKFFYRCYALETVNILGNITSVGPCAFYECKVLTSVNIPDTVTSIGEQAFYYCKALTSLNVPDIVTSIGKQAFYYCSSLTSINIPSKITAIADYTFHGCQSLLSVTVPDTVTSIGSYAFGQCEKLETVNIPAGVTSLGDAVFYNCNALKSALSIPAGITEIGTKMFSGCYLVPSITVPDSVTVIGEEAFRNCQTITSLNIPKGVTSIGIRAFSNCTSVTSATIPEGVTVIDTGLFYGCTKLETVTLPQNVTTINNGAFNKCSSLTEITIPGKVTKIDLYAFNDCDSLKSVIVPDCVTTLGRYAFYSCDTLESITLSKNIKTIEQDTFHNCKALKSVVIPDGVTSIGKQAFSWCTSLTTITIPDSVQSFGDSAFCYCELLEAVKIPYGITTIEDSTFESCESLTSIEIPGTVTSIGVNAIRDCSALETVSVPGSVKTIERGAFYDCDALVSITFNEGVETIGDSVLRDCDALAYVSFPSTLSSLGETVFQYDWSLTKFTVAAGNKYFCAENDVLFDKAKTTLIKYPGKKTDTSYTIPSTVKTLTDHSFSTAYNLLTVTIPDSVETIEEYAFGSCINITTVNMGKGVRTIGGYAFLGCEALESIVIPEGVTRIELYTFYTCESLKSVVIPDGVTYIGERAFCSPQYTALVSAPIPDSVTYIGDYAFAYNHLLEGVNLPQGLTYIGERAFVDCNKISQINIPDTVTDIGYQAFAASNTTPTIVVGGGIKEIDEMAFWYCNSLTSVVICDGVETIGKEAFAYSKLLTSAVIPDSVTSIDATAFSNCDNLVMHCSENSYALSYAKENNIAYKIIPSSVANLKVSASASASVTLSWDKNSSATGYIVEQYKDGEWVKLADTTSCTYTVSGLSSCTDYVFSVTAYMTSETEKLTSAPSRINVTTDHVYSSSFTIDKAATCTEEGSKSKHCTREGCNAKTSVTVIPVTDHSYASTITKQATCLETGIRTYKCVNCTNSYTETIPVTSHTYSSSYTVDVEATCTTEGSKSKHCTREGCNAKTSVTVIPMKGHSYTDTVVAPTYTEQGYTLHDCDNCDYSYKDNYKDKLALLKPVVTATAGDKQATLSWTKVEGASYYQIIRYNKGTYSVVADINGTSAVVKGLTNNYEYTYLVKAVAEDGRTSLSSAVYVTPVAPLSKPVVTATAGDKQVTLSWAAVSGASYYQIIRYNKGTYSVVADTDGTSAVVKGLTNNYEYTYLIKAVAEDGRTSLSSAVYVTPVAALAKPVVKATAGDKQATLSWTAVSGASYYQIIRYNKGTYSVVADINSTSAVVKGLTNNYEYTYLVKAVAEDGRSSLSSAVYVTPVAPLSKPVVKATAGDKQVTLSWTKVEGASYYQIIRYNKGTYSVVADINGTSAVVKGLTNNYEYTYLVKAVAEDGRTSLSSAVYVTPVAALAKPVVAATAGDKQVTLSWNAVNGASYYQIIRYNKGTYSVVADINGTSAVVKGLTNNYEYTYLIKAVAEDGRTSLSSAVYVTPIAALAKPVVKATAGDKQATLSWTVVEGASYYQIIRYNKGTYSVVADINGTSAVVKGLTNNYEYTYLVKAVAEDGRTSLSSAVYVTPVAPLSKPVVKATAGDKQATLSWTKVEGASYYQIIRYNKGTYSVVADINGTSAVVKGLTNNYEYTYLVKAVAEDGRTSLSSAVYVTPAASL